MWSLLISAALYPFPAPTVGPVTDETRFAWGVVSSVDAKKATFVLNTTTGPLTITVDAKDTKLVGIDGKPTTLASSVRQGTSARVYYFIGKGASATEVDVLGNAPAK